MNKSFNQQDIQKCFVLKFISYTAYNLFKL